MEKAELPANDTKDANRRMRIAEWPTGFFA